MHKTKKNKKTKKHAGGPVLIQDAYMGWGYIV
jgi:hypothetical protein